MYGWFVGGGRRASSDPVLHCFAAESESAVHDGKSGMKEESQTKTHRRTHQGEQRRYVLLQCTASVHCYI